MGTLRVYLTGRLLIESGQGSIVDHTRSSDPERVALAVLVLERHRPVDVTELAAALWEDERPTGWRATVDTGLERLADSLDELPEVGLEPGHDKARLALPPDPWVDIEHAHLALERARASLDEGDVARAIVASTAAAIIGKRPFLLGVDSPWVRSRRAAHEANLLDGLVIRARAALRSGGADDAVRVARQALAREPLHEPALRVLMRSMDASGDRVGALRVYEDHRATVAGHPGVAPTQRTQDLATELRTPATSGLDLLTPRQNEVAALVTDGLTNRQISERLSISLLTAETHVKHILMRLGVSSRSQVAALVAAQDSAGPSSD